MCSMGIKIVNGVCDEDNKCTQQNCDFCTNRNGIEECVLCREDYVILNVNG